jgi:hypothetical protein
MRVPRRLSAALAAGALLLALCAGPDSFAARRAESGKTYAVVNIDRIGHERLAALKALPSVEWWVELDDQLLVCGTSALAGELAGRHLFRVVEGKVNPKELRFVYRLHAEDAEAPGMRVLARGGHASVVLGAGPRVHKHGAYDAAGPHDVHATVAPFVPNTVLARQAANAPPGTPTEFDISIQALVDSVNGSRWHGDVQTLAGWNRWTRGDGVVGARDWLVQQFQSLPGLTVTTQAFPVGQATAYNVVATLQGTTRPNDWYIVGAHYDSTSQAPGTAAPGAEDNASGAAGVLEMARIFTAHPPEATVIFICYSGEEQGLIGSVHHASQLVATGDSAKVRAQLNMDMIGYTGDSDLDCLLETGAIGQFLIDAFATAAAQYTTLRIVTSLNPFGSDHVPYLDRGMPALLTIENDWNSYPSYHRTTDVASNVSIEMGAQVLRMNVGALAQMIGQPPAGRGADTPGVYVPATSAFFLRNSGTPGPADGAYRFGPAGAGWVAVTGDWNGDGFDTVGLYDPATSTYFLRNAHAPGPADVVTRFGPAGAGWTPIAGDWDGNGTDTVGLYSPTSGTFYLKNSNTPGPADLVVRYGPAGATPVVGDWDGNGTDTVGVFVPSTSVWFVRNSNTPGPADLTFSFGPAGAGWVPVAGDWNGDNAHTPGVYNPATGTWFLRNSNSAGAGSTAFTYGPRPGATPLRGDWDNH